MQTLGEGEGRVMGVYIKGMKMPKECGECDIYVCYRTWHGDPGDEFCGLTKKSVKYKTKPEWCPLSEVPERKTGKWLLYAQRDGIETGSECSQCGYHIYIPPQYGHNFCPNCGATMEKGEQK